MGLDIAFNRAAALDAGLVIEVLKNATEQEIAEAESDYPPGDLYLEYLRDTTRCIRVPGENFYTEDGGGTDDIVVRANKWGRIYAPLTHWLKANNITWSEF